MRIRPQWMIPPILVGFLGYMVYDLISNNIKRSAEREERHEHRVELDSLNYENSRTNR